MEAPRFGSKCGERNIELVHASRHAASVSTLRFLFAAVFIHGSLLLAAPPTPAPQRFSQEVARHHELTNGLPAAPVQLLDTAPPGTGRIFAGGSWFEWTGGQWRPIPELRSPSDHEFIVADANGKPGKAAVPWAGVRQIARDRSRVYLLTDTGIQSLAGGQIESLGQPPGSRVSQLAVSPDGELVAASESGLHQRTQQGWVPVRANDGLGRTWGSENVAGVAFDSKSRLWIAMRAGVGVRDGAEWRFYTERDGLPWNEFTSVATAPNGDVWFATRRGAIRWDGTEFHYRQGRGWLPDDDVRTVAADAAGSAWFLTGKGPGWIERRPMTLAEKAKLYEQELETRIRRTPFGYVAEGHMNRPGDRTSTSTSDSDNDGLWTSMYGAGECFAYGATGDPAALDRARRAFEALRFLQKVTQGGTPAPPKGYIARTIRSVELPDPNIGRIEGDREEQKRDKLWKVYEPRWPKSADGKWYWKSDTSSDELDGHYFFYGLYFDLCAKTEAERERVREVVRDVTDHLIEHGFTLTDHDGKPTRWAVYGPQFLNQDPFWWPERGLNSLSILSYLAVAEHVVGDPKYRAASRELIERHGYAHNAMYAKVQHGPGSGNQSDDEMAIMCYYSLLRCSQDEALKGMIRYSFFRYWANEAPEMNPFFHFAYAAHAIDRNVTNVWGRFPLSPWPGWHEDSMATLRGFPLDRAGWNHDNSHRLDIVLLPRQKAQDLYDERRHRRGHRLNGKVLPVENRYFNHWNTDPWDLDYGGGGHDLGSGAVFLLPYYMGLYHGFIEKP